MVNSEDYYYAAIGGVIIALATSLNLFMKGRITGISGVIFGVLKLDGLLWRLSFLLGLLFSYTYFLNFIHNEFFETPEIFTQGLSFIGFFICGLLVGFGTKLSNGCTSGHGVCGIPRFSIRSLVASSTFCAFGIAAAVLKHQVPFLYDQDFLSVVKKISTPDYNYAIFGILNSITLIIPIVILFKKKYEVLYDYFISLSTGIIFGVGLIVSGMIKRQKVINFLDVSSKNWDASLLIVLISAVSTNLILFYFIIKKKGKPLLADKLELPTKIQIDVPLVLGAAIFGIGWGFGGLCPGPLFVNILNYIPHTFAFFISMIIGQVAAFYTDKNVFNSPPKKLI